jgi:non-heme Fe2+,alpha-ketoglutarate-dependent halogenase
VGASCASWTPKTQTVGSPPNRVNFSSEPNRSKDRRIGLAIRYIPTDVRQLKVRDSATLVRGIDRDGNFDHEPRPKRDLDDAALAAHADAVGRQVKALYSGTDKQSFRA